LPCALCTEPTAKIYAGQSIRLRGQNLTETEHVKLGAYHTLELEPQRPFTLEKTEWDALDMERIRQACDPSASADLAAVLITV
jgi:protein pelota